MLPIVIRTPRSVDQFTFVPMPTRSKVDEVLEPQLLTGWWLHNPVTSTRLSTLQSQSRDGARKPEFHINLHLRRRWQSYVYNVMTVLFCVTGATFSALVLDPADFGSRANLIVVLLLTAVAFKSYVASMLPQLPYATVLDHYVFTSFALQVAALMERCVWVVGGGWERCAVWPDTAACLCSTVAAIVANSRGVDAARVVDYWFLAASAAAFVVYHLALAIRLRRWFVALDRATPRRVPRSVGHAPVADDTIPTFRMVAS